MEQRALEVERLDRSQLLTERQVTDGGHDNFVWPFVTEFSNQLFLVKKLISKQWHLIKDDVVLSPILPEQPRVVFRGVPCSVPFNLSIRITVIERTVRPLQVRLNEHIGNIRRGFRGHPVYRNYLEVHNMDPRGMSFLAIDKLKSHWRGGPKRRAIYKLEMSWIYHVKCLKPLGLNVDIEINAFIENS